MAVTRSGTTRLGVVDHVGEEPRPSFVTATILSQHTAEEVAGDLDRILNQKGVTHISVQVKFYESHGNVETTWGKFYFFVLFQPSSLSSWR